jgi:hypothetical protein
MLDGSHYFECACFSDEHTLKFTLDKDEEDPEIYTTVFLRHWNPWYRRVWIAIKYVFGYKCKYGHFDCFIMQPDDAKRLKGILEEFEVALRKKVNEQ